jgi:hypothetical protein
MREPDADRLRRAPQLQRTPEFHDGYCTAMTQAASDLRARARELDHTDAETHPQAMARIAAQCELRGAAVRMQRRSDQMVQAMLSARAAALPQPAPDERRADGYHASESETPKRSTPPHPREGTTLR